MAAAVNVGAENGPLGCSVCLGRGRETRQEYKSIGMKRIHRATFSLCSSIKSECFVVGGYPWSRCWSYDQRFANYYLRFKKRSMCWTGEYLVYIS